MSQRSHKKEQTHSIIFGYALWIFGFLGAHRFYFGRPISGLIWMLTLGLLGVGWFIDLFLIPSMHRTANRRFLDGPVDYNLAWVFLTFLGVIGIHRFYMGKWVTGLIWIVSGGLVGIGIAYDFWTLNDQIDELHRDL